LGHPEDCGCSNFILDKFVAYITYNQVQIPAQCKFK
jgi:hypothetical protein